MPFVAACISLFLSILHHSLDTIVLSGVDVVSSVKLSDGNEHPYSETTVGRVEIEKSHLSTMKEVSELVPNLFMPDYGSRIDQPVVGMSIDQMPLMNKNNYDFELFDIDKIQIIRGAQSTLFGRNTAGGAINITTLSPLNFQGKRLMLEYGNEDNVRVKAAHYAAPTKDFGWSAGVFYNHNGGFFTNNYLGRKCDGGDNATVRLRAQWLPAYGAAAYAQLSYALGAFDFEAGVCIDYERSSMRYNSYSLIHYTILGGVSGVPIVTELNGREEVDACEVLPLFLGKKGTLEHLCGVRIFSTKSIAHSIFAPSATTFSRSESHCKWGSPFM